MEMEAPVGAEVTVSTSEEGIVGDNFAEGMVSDASAEGIFGDAEACATGAAGAIAEGV
jgi:hypothetical protein